MSDVVSELIEDWLEKHPIDAPTPLPKKRQTTKTATAKTKRSKGTQQQNGSSHDSNPSKTTNL